MSEVLSGVVRLQDGIAFQATSGSDHIITLDGRPEHGGAGRGPSPMELLLLALGSCTGMTVLDLLRRRRQEVSGYEIHLEGEQTDVHPRIFKRIQVEHRIRGHALDPAIVGRAIELAATRYCPVMAMLGKATTIDERYRLIDDATGAELMGGAIGFHVARSQP
ncbi:MAG: OsmC family protein [Chloroflexota bacterium]